MRGRSFARLVVNGLPGATLRSFAALRMTCFSLVRVDAISGVASGAKALQVGLCYVAPERATNKAAEPAGRCK